MLATLESIKILDEANELAKMILESDVAENYRTHLYRMKTNKSTQQKIQAFVKMKDLYEEVQRFGRYHPDYKKVMMSIRETKREMDLDEHVANFKKAENDLQSLLDEVSVIVGHSVSEHIKVPTGNPFFESSCSSGGCGSGGSCGCS
ncbi:YlbF family regulator [Bacillus massilinigeriensis]|uniref:YlbF family regulator n=1 Tax=Bacillus massilionigeriensis TaxID=1805475 RepID=UPI00096B05A1|nr:YlbF family regulator [Bacillus massilionigeriensis]